MGIKVKNMDQKQFGAAEAVGGMGLLFLGRKLEALALFGKGGGGH